MHLLLCAALILLSWVLLVVLCFLLGELSGNPIMTAASFLLWPYSQAQCWLTEQNYPQPLWDQRPSQLLCPNSVGTGSPSLGEWQKLLTNPHSLLSLSEVRDSFLSPMPPALCWVRSPYLGLTAKLCLHGVIPATNLLRDLRIGPSVGVVRNCTSKMPWTNNRFGELSGRHPFPWELINDRTLGKTVLVHNQHPGI